MQKFDVRDAEGQTLTVTDPLSRVTTNTYTNRGWTATVTDPLGNVATYTYSNTGKPVTQSDPSHSGGTLVSYVYDNDDRLIARTDALNHTTSLGYDAVGNKITVTDANSNVTTYAYDSRNRLTTLTDPLAHNTVFGYDSGGNRITVKDANNNVTTTQYDALNRATTLTDARGGVTVLAFDAAGRNTVVADPVGNRTTFGYDAADRKTTMTDPLSHSATYGYDNANQLTDQTDRDGRRTTFAYDSGGRQTGETWVGASPSETVTYTYDNANELTGVTDANATLTFTYDSGGRQITAATSGTAGQPSVTLTSGFDQIGNRTTLYDSLSNTGRTTYTYDSALRLVTIARDFLNKATTVTTAGPRVDYAYDNANRLTSESRTIGGAGTAVATSFVYDNADRLTTLTHQVTGGSALATYVYGYDNGNRVTSEQNAEGTVTYGYDVTNELTGASGSRAETYTYDSGGNRTMTGYTTGTGNELLSSPGTTYTYDNEGNMTAQANTSTHVVTSYTYDYHNRLTGVTVGGSATATYVYDALGRRIGFKDNGTQTWVVWDGQNPYADFDGSGTLKDRYLYGPAIDALLARTDSGGTTAWYLTDRLGTVRDISSTAGAVIDHLSYDSFGGVLSESNSGNGDRFKFTGREYDATVVLYYYRARSYTSTAGRFITQDPLGFRAGDQNLYRYTGNNGVGLIDPSGTLADDCSGGCVSVSFRYPNQTPFDSTAPRQTYPPDSDGRNTWYFNTYFVSQDLYNTDKKSTYQIPRSSQNLFNTGCVGMATVRTGSNQQPGYNKTSPGVWFNDPNVAWEYWKSLSHNQQDGTEVVAIQSTPYPKNIEPIYPAPGRIRPGFNVGGDENYLTWQRPIGRLPYWERADQGAGFPGGMTVIRHGRLSPSYPGPPIIGIIPIQRGPIPPPRLP